MTKTEFMGQFDRLCRGFRHESTPEQAEAWFRRIGHYALPDWSEAVTTLLCAPRFPLLDPVLAALDDAQTHRRKTHVERDKPGAKSVFQRLCEEGKPLGCPFSPELFEAIKTFSARDQVRTYLSMQREGKDFNSPTLTEEALNREEARLTGRLAELLPTLSDEELSEFMDRYGKLVAT